MIARVFQRKTAMSPTDALAFFGPPTIENIADCIQAGVTEVHISVTFTWDLEKAEDLYYAFRRRGVNTNSGLKQSTHGTGGLTMTFAVTENGKKALNDGC